MSRVRPVALCVFRRGEEILVMRGKDPLTRESFHRPLGGTVEFGERAAEAAAREILEELGERITPPKLLGVVENVFTYGGRPLHEIVFVFEAGFSDAGVYERETIDGVEADGTRLDVRWVSLTDNGPDTPPLYPEGLRALLDRAAHEPVL